MIEINQLISCITTVFHGQINITALILCVTE